VREFSLICARRARSHGNSMWVISVGPLAQLYMLGRRPASFGRATRGAPSWSPLYSAAPRGGK